MGAAGERDVGLHVNVARDQVIRMHAHMVTQHRFQLVVQLLLGHLVVRRVVQSQIAGAVNGDAIIGIGQVLGRQPEIDSVVRQVAE